MTLISRFRTAIFTLALLGAASVMPAVAQEGCLSDAEIQSHVSSGDILPVAQVLEREGISASTQVLSVRVCDSGGGLQYVLAVLGASGEAQNLTLSAR